MPLPRWLARADKAGLNRVTTKVAPPFPFLAVVVHRGRRSGQRYETPVMVFPAPDGFIIALTYGPQHTGWVRNVVAAGGCQLRTGGRTLQMRSPRVYHDEARSGIRPAERQVLKLLGAADFLSLETVPWRRPCLTTRIRKQPALSHADDPGRRFSTEDHFQHEDH